MRYSGYKVGDLELAPSYLQIDLCESSERLGKEFPVYVLCSSHGLEGTQGSFRLLFLSNKLKRNDK